MANKDEKIKEQASNAIDCISSAIRESSKKIFDVCVENTTEVFSELFDKAVIKVKQKIEKGKDNGKKDSSCDS